MVFAELKITKAAALELDVSGVVTAGASEVSPARAVTRQACEESHFTKGYT